MAEERGRIYEQLRDMAPSVTPEAKVNILSRLEAVITLRRYPDKQSDQEADYGGFDRHEADLFLGRDENSLEDESNVSFWSEVQRDFLRDLRLGLPEGQTIAIAEMRAERGSIIITVIFYYITGKVAAKGVDLVIEGMSEYIGRTAGNYLENAIKTNLPSGYRRMKDIRARVEKMAGYVSKVIEVEAAPVFVSKKSSPWQKVLFGTLYLGSAVLVGGLLFDAFDIPIYEYLIESTLKRIPVGR